MTCVSPGVAFSPVGAFGVVSVVTATVADGVPAPTPLTARRPIVYAVPLVRPVIVTGLLVVAGAKAAQLTPPFVVYS